MPAHVNPRGAGGSGRRLLRRAAHTPFPLGAWVAAYGAALVACVATALATGRGPVCPRPRGGGSSVASATADPLLVAYCARAWLPDATAACAAAVAGVVAAAVATVRAVAPSDPVVRAAAGALAAAFALTAASWAVDAAGSPARLVLPGSPARPFAFVNALAYVRWVCVVPVWGAALLRMQAAAAAARVSAAVTVVGAEGALPQVTAAAARAAARAGDGTGSAAGPSSPAGGDDGAARDADDDAAFIDSPQHLWLDPLVALDDSTGGSASKRTQPAPSLSAARRGCCRSGCCGGLRRKWLRARRLFARHRGRRNPRHISFYATATLGGLLVAASASNVAATLGDGGSASAALLALLLAGWAWALSRNLEANTPLASVITRFDASGELAACLAAAQRRGGGDSSGGASLADGAGGAAGRSPAVAAAVSPPAPSRALVWLNRAVLVSVPLTVAANAAHALAPPSAWGAALAAGCDALATASDVVNLVLIPAGRCLVLALCYRQASGEEERLAGELGVVSTAAAAVAAAADSRRRYIRSVVHEVKTPFNSIVLGLDLLRGCRTAEVEAAAGEAGGGGEAAAAAASSDFDETLSMLSACCGQMARILNSVLSMAVIEAGGGGGGGGGDGVDGDGGDGARGDGSVAPDAVGGGGGGGAGGPLALSPAPLALGPDVVSRVVFQLAPWAAGAGCTLTAEVDPGVAALTLLGDAVRLCQLLSNYVSNALKHAPRDGGGHVAIAVTLLGMELGGAQPAAAAGAAAALQPLLPGYALTGAFARVRLAVTDNGRGLMPQECARLFEPWVMLQEATGSGGHADDAATVSGACSTTAGGCGASVATVTTGGDGGGGDNDDDDVVATADDGAGGGGARLRLRRRRRLSAPTVVAATAASGGGSGSENGADGGMMPPHRARAASDPPPVTPPPRATAAATAAATRRAPSCSSSSLATGAPAPPPPQGTGLGLSIAREIARRHGGSVGVTSAGLGRGATFYADLPLPVIVAAATPAAGTTAPGGGAGGSTSNGGSGGAAGSNNR
jgi:signal transduction histidine kinase